RRVRAMSGVRDDDLAARLRLTAFREVRAHEHEPRQLALRPGRGLERDSRQAGDLGEDLLEAPHELEGALRAVLLLERVEIAEAGEVHDSLVDPRVVLHRAGAERGEAGVDAGRARRTAPR